MKKSIYIGLVLFLLPVVHYAQTITENYVTSTSYQTETTSGAVSEDSKIETVSYFDGLGRPKQIINARSGGDRENIVRYIEHNYSDAPSKEYLPWASPAGTGVGFIDPATLLNEVETFYNTGKYENTLNPYNETRLENSPLLRPQEQGAPGTSWMINPLNDNDHTIKYEYGTNTTSDAVQHFKVEFPTGSYLSPQLSDEGEYMPMVLFKTVTKDENWQPGDGDNHTNQEFTNKLGQVILKRAFNDGRHDTYYVYDHFGNLTYVLPPEMTEAFESINYTDVQTNWPVNDFLTAGSNIPGNVIFQLDNNTVTINALVIQIEGFTGSLNPQTVKSIGVSPQIPDMTIGSVLGVTGYTGSGDPITVTAGTMEFINGDFVVNRVSSATFVSFIFSGSVALPTDNGIELEGLAFQYIYDGRNRLIKKKVPGKGWEQIVYDDLDRPILSRDANLLAQGKWLFTKYDAFDRIAYTGIFSPKGSKSGSKSGSRTSSLNETQSTSPTLIGDTQVYYSNNTYPSDNLEVLTINYYDNYVDTNGLTLPDSTFGVPITQATNGLPTVNKVRVLKTNRWITNLIGYDEKARAIFAASKNDYLTITDIAKTKLDFNGNVMANRNQHTKGTNTPIITLDYYNYDHANRLLAHMQQIDNEPVQLIAQNHYDELGQLTYKKVGGKLFESSFTAISNVSFSNEGHIEKTTGGSSSWNAGLITNGILADNGGLNFTIRSTGKKLAVGLNANNVNNNATDIDFGFQFKSSGGNPSYYQIRRPGGLQSGNHSYAEGDQFTIERDANIVTYRHNDELVFTYTIVTQNTDLFGDAGFLSEGGAISDFVLYATEVKSPLQKVDFRYNVRGWLTQINDVNFQQKSIALFNFKINYTNVEGTAGDPDKAVGLYNGNIAQTIWRTPNTDDTKRTYGYKYDAMNRISAAYSRKGNSLDINDNSSVWGISYDKNGNILGLNRNGYNGLNGPALWDDLDYQYNGNQLTAVIEQSGSTLNHLGFSDINTSGEDYSYDIDGNMVTDANKGITSIEYNHLNLPRKIVFNNADPELVREGTGIINVYDATGVRLEKRVVEGGQQVVQTEYAGLSVYKNGQFEFMSHPEGYSQPNSSGGYDYVFQFKDQLGNVRLSYGDANKNGSIDSATEIIKESNFYPFGLEQKGYNEVQTGGNDNAQNWKYQGQEFEEELGKDTYAFQWRDYDPALGRFNKPDRFAEKYDNVSPYQFTKNNPIYFQEIQGDSLNVADQYREQFYDDLREVFGENANLFEFSENGNVVFNGRKRDLTKAQRKVYNKLKRALKSRTTTNLIYEAQYTANEGNGSFVINPNANNGNNQNGGGEGVLLASDNASFDQNYIVIDPNANNQQRVREVTDLYYNTRRNPGSVDPANPPTDNQLGVQQNIQTNSALRMFHGVGHIIYDGKAQNKVLNFENKSINAYNIINNTILNARNPDLWHNRTITGNIE